MILETILWILVIYGPWILALVLIFSGFYLKNRILKSIGLIILVFLIIIESVQLYGLYRVSKQASINQQLDSQDYQKRLDQINSSR